MADTQTEDRATTAVAGQGEVVIPGLTPKVEAPIERVPLTEIAPAKTFRLDAGAIEVIRDLLCRGANDLEVKWFLYQCAMLGLNPLLPGQIAFAAYDREDGEGGSERRRVIMVEIGGMRTLAMRSGRYRQGEPPVIEFGANGIPTFCTSSIYERVDGAWVKHERRFAWDEFKAFHRRKMWVRMSGTMFAKACEAAMIRFYFADACAGVYVPEEIDAPELPGVNAPALPSPVVSPEAARKRRAASILRGLAQHYRGVDAADPKASAIAFTKQIVPGASASGDWTDADMDRIEAAATAIEQQPAQPAQREPGEEG